MFGVSGHRYQLLQDSGRGRRFIAVQYALWALVWMLSHLAGGAIVGLGLGWLGTQAPGLVHGTGPLLLGTGLLLGGLHQLQVVSIPMPQVQRQVPRHWLVQFPWSVTAVGYGLQLGAAVTTRIADASTYGALLAALVAGTPEAGATILAVFGVVRALPAVVIGPVAGSVGRAFAWALRLEASERVLARVSGLLLLLAGVAWLIVCWETGPLLTPN